MRVLFAGLTLSLSCLVAVAQGATKEELVTVDTFTALCDGARKTVDATQLKALLAKAQAEKPKADAQQKAADAEATKAVEALDNTVVQQGLAIQDDIAKLNKQIATANAEVSRLTETMGREGTGPAFQNAFKERNAKLDEIERLKADAATVGALSARLAAAAVDFDTASGNAAKAEVILKIVPDLGVSGTMSFAGPLASWSAARLALAGADAVIEAAKAATECVSKKLATIEEAKAEEAKFLRNNLIRLGQAMQTKQTELKQAEKTASAVVGRMFSGATDAQINAAVNNYLKVSDEFVAMGVEFHTEVNKLAAKGIATEPWMTQVINAYMDAKKVADQAKAKRKR